MASKRPGPSSSDEVVVKRKRTALTLETKLEICTIFYCFFLIFCPMLSMFFLSLNYMCVLVCD